MKDLFKDIKARLLAHESDMDLDSAWASLEARRDKVQKKSRLRLASVLLLLLWIGGCGTWMWVKNLNNHAAQTAQQQGPTAVAPSSAEVTAAPAAVTPVPAPLSTSAEQTKSINNLTDVTHDMPKRPTRDFLYAKEQSFYASTNTKTAVTEGGNEGVVPVQNTNQTQIENNALDIKTTSITLAPSAQATSITLAPIVQSTSGVSPIETSPTQATGTTRDLPPSLRMLAKRNLGLLASKPSPLNLPTRYHTQISEKSAKKKANYATAVYVGGGWLTTQQKFSAQEGQSAQGVALRNETERALPSFTLHAGVQRWIGKGRLLDFGVHYDQWYDRLDYTFDKPHTYKYNDVLLDVRRLDATGAEVKKYGDIAVDGTQKVHALYYNRYSSINLRLALVQSIYHKGRWDIALGAGMNASLWARADGLVSAPDPVQGTYELDKIYKNAFGVGINALTRVTYKFNDHYALQLTPAATWGLGNVLNTTSPLQSRLRQYSATAGLVYKF